jgi:hypothetical protein
VALLPAALLVASCGGDSSSAKTATPAKSTSPAGPATVAGQPTKDQGQPTPTKVPDDGIVLTLASSGKQYRPKLSEFKALPQSDIDVNGKKQSGVLLADLVKQVPAGSSGFVQIQGLESDLKKVANVRFKLDDVASTTVLMLDPDGHVNVASSSIPEAQWVKAVNAIVLN